MLSLPPRVKHLLVSRAPLALEAAALLHLLTGRTRRSFAHAPAPAYRILAYHQTPASEARDFRRQMEWLSRNRRVMPLRDVIDQAVNGTLSDKRAVAITFDDGFANNFEIAAPILREMGLSACFFIATDFIALAGRGPEALREWEARVYRFTKAAPPMNWEQVRQLTRDGFEIGCHTRSHAKLAALQPAQIRDEITASCQLIESGIGARPDFFAYPYGKTVMAPPQSRVHVMEAGGFRAAFSTERGWNTEATAREWLHRDSMEPRLSPRLLDAFLSGVFDKNPS